jgi:hypothetical protein
METADASETTVSSCHAAFCHTPEDSNFNIQDGDDHSHEDRDNTYLRNVGNFLPNNTASHPRKEQILNTVFYLLQWRRDYALRLNCCQVTKSRSIQVALYTVGISYGRLVTEPETEKRGNGSNKGYYINVLYLVKALCCKPEGRGFKSR